MYCTACTTVVSYVTDYCQRSEDIFTVFLSSVYKVHYITKFVVTFFKVVCCLPGLVQLLVLSMDFNFLDFKLFEIHLYDETLLKVTTVGKFTTSV